MCTQLASIDVRSLICVPTAISGAKSTRLPKSTLPLSGSSKLPDARSEEDFIPKLTRDSERPVMRLPGGMHRDKEVLLQPQFGQGLASPAEHDVGAALDAAQRERRIDIMDIDAAENLVGFGGRGDEGRCDDRR